MSPSPDVDACYLQRRAPRARVVLRREWAELLAPLVDHTGAWRHEALGPVLATLEGRGRPTVHRLGERRVVCKRALHGGLLRALTGARFLSPARFWRELAGTLALGNAGVPVAPLLMVHAARGACGCWRVHLLTEWVPDSRDLLAVLAGEAPASRARRAALRAAGRTLRRMHDAGWRHGDLNVKNLLVENGADGATTVRVLDLACSHRTAAPMSPETRARNLARLWRSALKQQTLGRLRGGRTDALRLRAGYEEAGPALPRAAWRALLGAGAGWHRWLWRPGTQG